MKLVYFRFVHDHDMPTNGAYVGLATPGEAGSWQRECKVLIIIPLYTQTFESRHYISNVPLD